MVLNGLSDVARFDFKHYSDIETFLKRIQGVLVRPRTAVLRVRLAAIYRFTNTVRLTVRGNVPDVQNNFFYCYNATYLLQVRSSLGAFTPSR